MSLANALRPMRCGVRISRSTALGDVGVPPRTEKSARKAALSGPIFGFLVALSLTALSLAAPKQPPISGGGLRETLEMRGAGSHHHSIASANSAVCRQVFETSGVRGDKRMVRIAVRLLAAPKSSSSGDGLSQLEERNEAAMADEDKTIPLSNVITC